MTTCQNCVRLADRVVALVEDRERLREYAEGFEAIARGILASDLGKNGEGRNLADEQVESLRDHIRSRAALAAATEDPK